MAKSVKQTGPLQNIFIDIQKLIDEIETKDLEAATAAETEESSAAAEVWLYAQVKEDAYITYKNWWTKAMFQEIRGNVKTIEYNKYLEKPYTVPYEFQEALREKGREKFLAQFVEKNDYYRMLMGLPSINDTEDDFIYLSEELYTEYGVPYDTPVHLLSDHLQNLYMNTDEYKAILEAYPDKKYLLYFGDKKISLYTARKAKDFEIIRYPSNRTDINPVILKEFAKIYAECREYIMTILYNERIKELYKNYREFMGLLIMSYALMRLSNVALEGVNTGKYMDDTILHIILSMYGIPDTMLMNNNVRRDLVSNIKKLIKEKGTQQVYYDIVRILGYQDITISKLLLMKNQKFDENGTALDEYDPYFVQVDIKDGNPYNTIVTKKAKSYTYHEIIDADPMWWDLPEVRQLLQDKKYTIADSKYITIESMIHQTKYIFESVYFTRMILDNKDATDKFMISIPELFGTTMVSVYDIILFVICATCLANGLTGDIISDEDELLAVSGFNFEAYNDIFNTYLEETKYVDKTRLRSFLSNLTISSEDDVNRVFNDTIYPLREWLEKKIIAANEKEEYIEYENIYRALFTYDINRNKFLDDFQMPMETIIDKYEITEDEMEAFQYFYPHANGKAVTVGDFGPNYNVTKYHWPFLSLNERVDWNIHIIVEDQGTADDRGYLYFWDVINCDDVRELTNPNGTRIFMDFEDEELGWVLNTKAVNKALDIIESLDDDMLTDAYFQIYTPTEDGAYSAKEKLPPIIRASGIWKSILIDKITLDCNGLCDLPKTYFESLYRKNIDLYNLLMDNNRYETDRQAWYNDISSIITAMESSLSIHMKYFEQSIIGEQMFFKPLITLINHFKSTFVDIARTSVKYVFDSKIDIGGNSNMLKLFDDIPASIFKLELIEAKDDSNFGLYDAEVKTRMKIFLDDKYMKYRMRVGEGFLAKTIEVKQGSVRMHDECIVYKNGAKIDNGVYRYEEPENFNRQTVTNVDLEPWQPLDD